MALAAAKHAEQCGALVQSGDGALKIRMQSRVYLHLPAQMPADEAIVDLATTWQRPRVQTASIAPGQSLATRGRVRTNLTPKGV